MSQQLLLAAEAMLTAKQAPFKSAVQERGDGSGSCSLASSLCFAGAALAAQQPLTGTTALLAWPSQLGCEQLALQPEGSSQIQVTGAEQAAAGPSRDAARQPDLVGANPRLSSGSSTSSGNGGTISISTAGLR